MPNLYIRLRPTPAPRRRRVLLSLGAPPQIGFAATDTSVGAWTNESGGTTNLYQSIDETTASDSDYVQSEANPQASVYEASFASLTDPTNNTGHVVNVRALIDQVVGGAVSLITELRNGASAFGTPITFTDALTSTATTYTHALSTVQADQIAAATAYGGLRLRWTATQAASSAPTYVAAGTAAFTATNGATITPGLPAGWAADDIHILFAHRSDNTAATSLTGWTNLAALTGNNTAGQRVEVWWRRAVGGDTAPVFTFGSSTVVRGAQIVGIRGCTTSGDPFDTSTGAPTRSSNAASATVTFTDLTTTSANTFVLALGAYEDDPTTVTTMTNYTQPGSAVQGSSLGSDMMLFHEYRTLANAGVAGASSITVSGGTFANSPNVGMVIAFLPIAGASKAQVTWADVEIPAPVGGNVTGTAPITLSPLSIVAAATYTPLAITGTAAVTLAPLSVAATGAETFASTAASTLARFSIASVGVEAFVGTGAVTLARFSEAAVGAETFTATAAVTLARFSVAGAAATTDSGTADVTLAPLSIAGAASLAFVNTAAVVLAQPSIAATGTYTPLAITGTAPVVLPGLSVAAAGAESWTATVAVTLAPLSVAGASAQTFTGTGAVVLAQPSVAAVGTYTPTAITGTASVVLPGLSIAAAAAESWTATAAITLPGLSVAGLASILNADGAVTLAQPSLAATGVYTPLAISGTADVVLSGLSVSASATYTPNNVTGTSAVTLPSLSIVAFGVAGDVDTGQADITLAGLSIDAIGDESWTGIAGIVLAPVSVTVVGVEAFTASATVTLTQPVASALVAETFAATGAVTLAGLSIAAAGDESWTGTADVVLTSIAIAAVVDETFVASAAVALSQPGVSVFAVEAFVGTGAVTLPPPGVAAAGTYTPLDISGTADVVLPSLSVAGSASTGSGLFTVAGDIVLTPLSVEVAGEQTFTGVAALTLGGVQPGAFLSQDFDGTIDVVLASFSVDAAATTGADRTATADLTLAQLSVDDSVAVLSFDAAGDIVLAPPFMGIAGPIITPGPSHILVAPTRRQHLTASSHTTLVAPGGRRVLTASRRS